jgi:hypothetical protein
MASPGEVESIELKGGEARACGRLVIIEHGEREELVESCEGSLVDGSEVDRTRGKRIPIDEPLCYQAG